MQGPNRRTPDCRSGWECRTGHGFERHRHSATNGNTVVEAGILLNIAISTPCARIRASIICLCRFMACWNDSSFGANENQTIQGCGKLTFIDVRELAPGGIIQFRTEIRQACERGAAASQTSDPARPSHYPTPPAQAHIATADASVPTPDDPRNRTRQTHVEEVTHGNERAPEEYPQTQQYLLLCINTRRFRVLRHVDIEPLIDDAEFFRRIRSKYEETRRDHEWKLLLLIPRLFASACTLLAHKLPSFTPRWVTQCFHWDSWPGFEVIKRGVPVRVRIRHTYHP